MLAADTRPPLAPGPNLGPDLGIAGCGSAIFTETTSRLRCMALADRIELNKLRQEKLYGKRNELTDAEHAEDDMRQRQMDADRDELARLINALVGVDFDRLGLLL